MCVFNNEVILIMFSCYRLLSMIFTDPLLKVTSKHFSFVKNSQLRYNQSTHEKQQHHTKILQFFFFQIMSQFDF